MFYDEQISQMNIFFSILNTIRGETVLDLSVTNKIKIKDVTMKSHLNLNNFVIILFFSFEILFIILILLCAPCGQNKHFYVQISGLVEIFF